MVYSSFEATRLRELGEHFKDLASSLARVRKRIVDLLPLIRDHVYDPDFHGSFSLKSVLPALVPELGYDNLEITDGGLASLAYAEMLDHNHGRTPSRATRGPFSLIASAILRRLVELFKVVAMNEARNHEL